MLSGAALALVGSASAHAPAAQLGTNVAGVPYQAIPAQADLKHIESQDEPPADVVKSLTVPANSKYIGDSNEAADADQYERSISFSVPNPSNTVALFYSKVLAAAHWSLQFNGKAAGDLELIAERNGSDDLPVARRRRHHFGEPAALPALAGSSRNLDELGRHDGVPGRGRQLGPHGARTRRLAGSQQRPKANCCRPASFELPRLSGSAGASSAGTAGRP